MQCGQCYEGSKWNSVIEAVSNNWIETEGWGRAPLWEELGKEWPGNGPFELEIIIWWCLSRCKRSQYDRSQITVVKEFGFLFYLKIHNMKVVNLKFPWQSSSKDSMLSLLRVRFNPGREIKIRKPYGTPKKKKNQPEKTRVMSLSFIPGLTKEYSPRRAPLSSSQRRRR